MPTGPGVSINQRNSVIVQCVEKHGSTAVALFINALRQSGQLHLASSLDTDQRILPVHGQGYFGKSRHKGGCCCILTFDRYRSFQCKMLKGC